MGSTALTRVLQTNRQHGQSNRDAQAPGCDESGVLRPAEHLPLEENQLVSVIILDADTGDEDIEFEPPHGFEALANHLTWSRRNSTGSDPSRRAGMRCRPGCYAAPAAARSPSPPHGESPSLKTRLGIRTHPRCVPPAASKSIRPSRSPIPPRPPPSPPRSPENIVFHRHQIGLPRPV